MDNFDFDVSAYVAQQTETNEDALAVPELMRPDFAVGDKETTDRDETEMRPAPEKENNAPDAERPSPRKGRPHRERKSDGNVKTFDDCAAGHVPHGGKRNGKDDKYGETAPDGDRPTPLPSFPHHDGHRPRPVPTPYGENKANGGDAAELRQTSRPIPDGNLADKIVPRVLSENETLARNAALGYDFVAGARAVETDEGVLVAVLVDSVFLVSERRELKELLRAEIERATGTPALVTYDLGTYRKIKPNMSNEAKSALYAAASARN